MAKAKFTEESYRQYLVHGNDMQRLNVASYVKNCMSILEVVSFCKFLISFDDGYEAVEDLEHWLTQCK